MTTIPDAVLDTYVGALATISTTGGRRHHGIVTDMGAGWLGVFPADVNRDLIDVAIPASAIVCIETEGY